MSHPHRFGYTRRERDASTSRPHGSLTLVRGDDSRAAPRAACDAMLADLEREISAARRQVAESALSIESGALLGREQPFWVYRLTLGATVPPLRAEDPVLLVFPDRREPALVMSASDREISVATKCAIRVPDLPRAQLVSDPTWLLERLRDRLRQLRDGATDNESQPAFNDSLALLAVGAGDLTCNTLPPAHAIPDDTTDPLNTEQQAAVRASFARRVLFLWGPPGTGKSTTLASIVDAHVQAGHRVLVLAPSNAATDVIAGAVAQRLSARSDFDAGVVLRAGPRPTKSLLTSYAEHLVPHRVARRLATEAYGARRSAVEDDVRRLSELRSHLDESSRARPHLDRECRVAEEVLACLTRWEKASSERRYEQLLDDCRVLVAPVHHVYLSQQVRGPFDTVVVDEASMITLPQLYVAAGLARSHVVVAGDYMQLPAPLQHRRADEVPWLATDPFTRVGIPAAVAREDDPDFLVMLQEQYRMAPAICELVSRFGYAGRLRTAPSIVRRPLPPWALHTGAIVLVDTSTLRPRATVPPGTHSRTNATHVDVVGRLVASLCDRENGSDPGKLLVMSPYAEQVRLLHDALRPAGRSRSISTQAASVHRAQGSEADTVILSIDDADGAPASTFILGRDARLLNVAISRARGRVIVVSDVPYLLRVGGPAVRELVAGLREHGHVIAVGDF